MSVIDKLAGLVEKLYAKTEGYEDNPADAQLWYNRGYANGVVAYFSQSGLSPREMCLSFKSVPFVSER